MSNREHLTAAREKELFGIIANGGPDASAARDEVVLAYLPLAYRLAWDNRNGPIPLEDLKSIATLTLVEALDRYDAERNRRFSSLASRCIQNAFFHEYASQGVGGVSFPKELYQALYAMRNDPSKDLAEIAKAQRVTPDEMGGFIHRSLGQIDLDEPTLDLDNGEQASLGDALAVQGMGIDKETAIAHARFGAKWDALSREEKIIVLHRAEGTRGAARELKLPTRKVKEIGDEAFHKLGAETTAAPTEENWGSLVGAWQETFGGARVGAAEILPLAKKTGVITPRSADPRIQRSAVSRLIGGKENRIYRGHRIAPAEVLKMASGPSAKQWRLEPAQDTPPVAKYASAARPKSSMIFSKSGLGTSGTAQR